MTDRQTLNLGPFETVAPPATSSERCGWFVAAVYEGHDQDVAKALCEAGWDAYSPSETVAGKRRRWRHDRWVELDTEAKRVPLFPGYVFVLMPLAGPFHLVERAKHVVGLLRMDGAPRPVTARVSGVNVVEAIRAAETMGAFDRTMKKPDMGKRRNRRFKPGQAVRVQDGPFAGFAAQIQGYTSGQRLRVLLDYMGRSTPVELGEMVLEPV